MAQLPRIFLFCRTAMGRVWRLGGRIRENTSAGGCGEEHDIVDREIGDLPLAGYLALIGQYECLLDMVVLILDKGVERAVYGIVLAGLDLKGDGGKAAVIVDQVIDLALAAVVIVVQLIAIGGQFAGDDSLIDGSQIESRAKMPMNWWKKPSRTARILFP